MTLRCKSSDPLYRVGSNHSTSISRILDNPPWPTPSSDNFRTRGGDRKDELGLSNLVKKWSTPTGDDANNVTRASGAFKSLSRDVFNWSTPKAARGGWTNSREGKRLTLEGEASNWVTPIQRDYKSGKGSADLLTRPGHKPPLSTQIENGDKGMLNPDWEETLMGWPVGWTNWTEPCAGLWPGFPMGQGPQQFDYEPPRTMPKGAVVNRTKRIEMIGNGVVWMCAAEAFYELLGGKK